MSDTDFIAYENHRLTIANAELRKERDELEQHIKRLEEVGDKLYSAIYCGCLMDGPCKTCSDAADLWDEIKEAKP